jgi:Uma2 family endonuclease
MQGMAVAQRMTTDEFLATYTEESPGRTIQLIAGEVVVNQPALPHQRALFKLVYALGAWAQEEAGRGEVSLPLDVRVDDENVYAPDLLWYAEERVAGLGDHGPYPIPELAVEVRSPSTWRYDVGVKRHVYEQRGLRELWLVDTKAHSVLVYRRSTAEATAFDVSLELERDDTVSSPLLPGFALPVAAVFPA